MKKYIIILILCCFLISSASASISITGTTMFKSISDQGVISDNSIDSTDQVSMVSIEVGGQTSSTMKGGQIQIIRLTPPIKIITAQLYPQAQVLVSDDGNTFMQTGVDLNFPQLEIYYGYQQDANHPWSQYLKVEENQTIHADFTTRQVWITPTNHTKIQEVIDSGEIPMWDDLP